MRLALRINFVVQEKKILRRNFLEMKPCDFTTELTPKYTML